MTHQEMLDRLLKNFWYNDSEKKPGLEWSFIEGTTLGHIDSKLNEALKEYRPELFE